MRTGLVVVLACAAPAPAPRAVEAPLADVAAEPARAVEPAEFAVTRPFRLPHAFEPTGYPVRIDLDELPFAGHVEIDGTLAEAVALRDAGDRAARCDGGAARGFAAARRSADRAARAGATRAGAWTLVIDYRSTVRQLVPHDTDMPDAWAEGLFRRVEGGRSYWFTQGEAIHSNANARRVALSWTHADRRGGARGLRGNGAAAA